MSRKSDIDVDLSVSAAYHVCTNEWTGTFANMRAEVMSVDSPDNTLPCFVCVDMQSVQILANVVQRLELWINGTADVGLDA